MPKQWVDFKKVKEAISIQAVLDRYSITGLSQSGDELRGGCPIHKGSAKKKTFTVNIRKNAFRCFSTDCNASGNVLDFVAAMELCTIRDAALKLEQWFNLEDRGQAASAEKADEQEGEVSRGIYKDCNGSLVEVLTSAVAQDLQRVIVYRELFGDYSCRIGSPDNFGTSDRHFTIVKRW